MTSWLFKLIRNVELEPEKRDKKINKINKQELISYYLTP